MKKTLSSVLALALALSSALPGCTDEDTKKMIADQSVTAQSGLDQSAHPAVPPKRYNPLVVSDKVWTGNTALHMTQGMPLPERFEGAHGVAVVSSDPMTVSEIMEALQLQTGITMNYSDAGARGGARAARGNAPAATGAAAAPASDNTSMQISYEGSMSGLLDRVCGYFGLSWHFDGNVVYVTRLQTRVFTVEALPGTQTVEDGMKDDSTTQSSSSSSGSSGGGSSQNSVTQNSKFSIDVKYWEELERVVNSLLGGVGNAVVSPSLGTVTVTTSPRNMQLIADYLNQENQRISRQIAVSVEIYSVSLTDGIDFTLAFNTALRRLANFSGNITTAAGPTTVSGFTGGGALSLAILNPHNHANEVSDVFTALSGIGNTTKVAKFPMITLNNRPVSRRIGKDVTYVASATSNTTGSGTSSTFAGTTLTPGTVHQGFSVQLTPRLLDDGRILLQYSLSIIDVLSITSFNSVTGSSTSSSTSTTQGSSTIELPTTSNRIFVQQSVLKSGSTLFIGGADEQDAQQNSQGVGDPENYALGGGLSSGKQHTMIFFALTPQVLETPHTEQE